MTPKLKSGFWVAAYIRRLHLNDIAVFVTQRGDEDAGAVLIKSNTLNGMAMLYHRSFDIDGNRNWEVLAQGEVRSIEDTINRQRGFDPDIWVLEVEDRAGRTLLDEAGLSG